MIDFAINLEPLYPGLELSEKVERVSAAGFSAVEFWDWQDKDIPKLKKTCQKCGVKVRAFSGTGSWSLCDREHRREYMDWVKRSISAAKELDCDTLILFPNHFTPEGCADFRQKYRPDGMVANITSTLVQLAPVLEENEVIALLEPICNLGSDAGMSVTDTAVGAEIVRAVDSTSVRLLCDLFHMQMMHGDLLRNLTSSLDIMSYIHVADAPGRNEPGTGEINFAFLCQKLKEAHYGGTVCFEYYPQGDPESGFSSLHRIMNLLQSLSET